MNLYEFIDSRIRAFIAARLSAEAIEDVLQDIRLAAFRKEKQLFQLDEPQQQSFLYTIANRAVANHYRARWREELPYAPETMPETPTQEAGFGAVELDALLETLPPERRALVVARFVEGHSLAELARASGKPAGTLRWQLHDAITRLREQYLQEAKEDFHD